MEHTPYCLGFSESMLLIVSRYTFSFSFRTLNVLIIIEVILTENEYYLVCYLLPLKLASLTLHPNAVQYFHEVVEEIKSIEGARPKKMLIEWSPQVSALLEILCCLISTITCEKDYISAQYGLQLHNKIEVYVAEDQVSQ